jgi:Lipopolysaccharide-assembly
LKKTNSSKVFPAFRLGGDLRFKISRVVRDCAFANNKLQITNHKSALLLLIALCFTMSGCKLYSLSGAATTARTMQVDLFYNNTDLGPANLSQNFTNRLKDYFQQNSSLKIVPENGELQIEGTITQYSVSPIAPVSNTSASQPTQAALTRLTIGIKANYVDTTQPKNSFKDKTFSFYADFPNDQNLLTVQESLEKRIFDQIFLDMFNATIANW